jgi:hypothetical protein
MAGRVWYAGYGSNLNRQRFLCYILGGRPRYGRKHHGGSRDAAPPGGSRIVVARHRLYFALPEGRSGTENWGRGGVAFIEPEIDESAETVCRMWMITGEQYEDVKEQEGRVWYDKEMELGEEAGVPILTVTHSRRLQQILPPSHAYLRTIAAGLRETAGLSADQTVDYFMDKPGIKGKMTRYEIMRILGDLAEDGP